MLQHPEHLPDPGMPLTLSMGLSPPVVHRAWREARDRALASVCAGDGLILVLGPPGTGKSLLLRDLVRTLGDAEYDVLLQPRGDIPIELAEATTDSSGKPRPRVVLIDEADRMNGAALERLGQLRASSLVLAGLAGPGSSLERLSVPATVVSLAPLTPDEVGAFAAARLARAGRYTMPLDERAASRLAEHSGGVPRVLDILIAAAMFFAATEGAARIEAAHIDEAAEMRDGDAAPPAQAEMNDAQRPGAEAAVRADMPPIRRAPARSYVAALCAAAGVAALCGWLALRPSEHAQPVLAQRSAAPPAAPSAPVEAATPPAAKQGMEAPAPATAELSIIGTLPASAPAHVVLLYARGDADAAARAADLARTLRAAGVAVDDPVATESRAGRLRARYFFAEDKDTAGAVLKRAGLSADGVMAGSTRPSSPPRPGTIEITMPSS